MTLFLGVGISRDMLIKTIPWCLLLAAAHADSVNPSVGPLTCNGDWTVTLAGFYWNAHQDGLEYVILDKVNNFDIPEFDDLIGAKMLSPHFKWDFGFSLGVGYTSPYDGWDLNLLWTHFQGRASRKNHVHAPDNLTLNPLWTTTGDPSFSDFIFTRIHAHWKLQLNLVDLELGREFWLSQYLTFRPHVGIRYSSLDQKFEMHQAVGIPLVEFTPLLNDEIDLKNDFQGAGLRTGIDTNWILGRGFAIYAKAALSLVYGRFDIGHNEYTRELTSPFHKTPLIEVEDRFHTSKMMLDTALGLEWMTRFSDCEYVFSLAFGWEQHLFFNQNQLWKVVQISPPFGLVVHHPENTYIQNRGDLSTQGWTLRVTFSF